MRESKRAREQVSAVEHASRQTNERRASGPVFMSEFLSILDHSAGQISWLLENIERKRQRERERERGEREREREREEKMKMK